METTGFHECLAGKAFLRDTCETFYFAELSYLIHTFCTHIIYTPIGAHIVTWSKAHITGSKTGVSQIPRDSVEEEGGDTNEEIERFTFAPESSAQPSSQAQARGPDRLDRLIAIVDQMFGMLDSHMQHIVDQFAYIQGQITALSSQIEDMLMMKGLDLESEQF